MTLHFLNLDRHSVEKAHFTPIKIDRVYGDAITQKFKIQ